MERVDAYTRVSLYLLLWGFCASILVSALATAADSGDEVPTPLAALALVGGIVVTALGTWALRDVIALYPRDRPLPWPSLAAVLVAGLALVVGVAPFVEGSLRGAVAVLAVINIAGSWGGLVDRTTTAAVVVGGGLVTWATGGETRNLLAGIAIAAFIVFTVQASLWMLGIVSDLDEARQAQARLAVAEERLRFSRDVHDVLGRRLSAIALQAELAAALAARGDSTAADRMLEVRATAHDALAEARELARGYRPTDFPTEVDGARSLLRSAGIEVGVEVDLLPRGWHEAAGWVVREAVTNALRHSEARRVDIAYADDVLSIVNDGVRGSEVVEGSGLGGLRERLGALGATLSVEASRGRWTVRVVLPGAGPLTAGVAVTEEATT